MAEAPEGLGGKQCLAWPSAQPSWCHCWYSWWSFDGTRLGFRSGHQHRVAKSGPNLSTPFLVSASCLLPMVPCGAGEALTPTTPAWLRNPLRRRNASGRMWIGARWQRVILTHWRLRPMVASGDGVGTVLGPPHRRAQRSASPDPHVSAGTRIGRRLLPGRGTAWL
jgi:hypothetical protein